LRLAIEVAQAEPARPWPAVSTPEKQLAELRSQMEAQKLRLPLLLLPLCRPRLVASPAPVAAPRRPDLPVCWGQPRSAGLSMSTAAAIRTSQPNRTMLCATDVNSSQFALNIMNWWLTGADATASRVGYHVALGFGQAMNLINGG
jgi:hypothetical protein